MELISYIINSSYRFSQNGLLSLSFAQTICFCVQILSFCVNTAQNVAQWEFFAQTCVCVFAAFRNWGCTTCKVLHLLVFSNWSTKQSKWYRGSFQMWDLVQTNFWKWKYHHIKIVWVLTVIYQGGLGWISSLWTYIEGKLVVEDWLTNAIFLSCVVHHKTKP